MFTLGVICCAKKRTVCSSSLCCLICVLQTKTEKTKESEKISISLSIARDGIARMHIRELAHAYSRIFMIALWWCLCLVRRDVINCFFFQYLNSLLPRPHPKKRKENLLEIQSLKCCVSLSPIRDGRLIKKIQLMFPVAFAVNFIV